MHVFAGRPFHATPMYKYKDFFLLHERVIAILHQITHFNQNLHGIFSMMPTSLYK